SAYVDTHSSFLFDRLSLFHTDTPPTDIYTLSLHDALPICERAGEEQRQQHGTEAAAAQEHVPERDGQEAGPVEARPPQAERQPEDRKSTRLNSSHVAISYAVFCLKKKKKR